MESKGCCPNDGSSRYVLRWSSFGGFGKEKKRFTISARGRICRVESPSACSVCPRLSRFRFLPALAPYHTTVPVTASSAYVTPCVDTLLYPTYAPTTTTDHTTPDRGRSPTAECRRRSRQCRRARQPNTHLAPPDRRRRRSTRKKRRPSSESAVGVGPLSWRQRDTSTERRRRRFRQRPKASRIGVGRELNPNGGGRSKQPSSGNADEGRCDGGGGRLPLVEWCDGEPCEQAGSRESNGNRRTSGPNARAAARTSQHADGWMVRRANRYKAWGGKSFERRNKYRNSSGLHHAVLLQKRAAALVSWL